MFSKNRNRLLTSDVALAFFAAVIAQARRFMSDEHFTVDGALIRVWASQKSFKKKSGSDDDGTHFHRDKRSNARSYTVCSARQAKDIPESR